VSAEGSSRREALCTAALGAGALAVGGMVRPALAGAQSPDDEDLRDFLVEAIALEQITALAYAEAARSSSVTPEQATTLDTFRDQEQAHANAFRQALDTLGFDLPEPPDSPEDTGVLEDVDGLESEASERLIGLLEGIAGQKDVAETLEYLQRLERAQIDYYITEAPGVDSVDLTTTSAEITGCQAQHMQVLGTELGLDPAKAAALALSDPSGP
jgi:rubrerythrin